ncbi:MAG TPA: DUF3467 domain-containing protein [Nitrospirota bacterium]|jgi:hypothetical protein
MAEKPSNPQGVPPALTFEIRPEVEGGVYSNVASVVHNPNEFVFDFAAILPGKDSARVQARVITTPGHAKQFLAALAENVAAYEQNFGEISQAQQLPPGPQTIH